MRVLEVINCLNNYGGVEMFSIDFCKYLAKRSSLFIAILYSDVSDAMIKRLNEYVEEDHIFLIGKKGSLDFKAARRLKRIIIKYNIDIIHCEAASLITAFISELTIRKKAPIFYTIHSIPEKDAGNNRLLYKKILKKKYVHGVTISQTNYFLCKKFYKKANLFCIENGIDLEKFNIFKNIEDRKNDILIVGRFTEAKNYPGMISIIKRIVDKGLDIKVEIYGSGALEKNVVECIKTYKLGKHIKLMGNSSNMNDVYNNSHIFLMNSIFEGNPLSLMEAMSCGCIPVTSNVGGIPDVLPKNYEFCFEHTELSRFADTIISILNNIELQSTVQKDIISKAQEFSFVKTADLYLDLFCKSIR